MKKEEKLMLMFNEVHGQISSPFYTEIVFNNEQEPVGVNVMKDGSLCWHTSRETLVFDYVTLDMGASPAF